MKKSKIIIPALAIIAFSTAASIAGSVAWFTASRTASLDAGTYAVVKTNADLAYDLTEGAGTTIQENTKEAVVVDGKLTDGSVNHGTKKAYAPNANGTGFAADPKGEVDLTAAKSTLESNLLRGSFTTGTGTEAVTTKIYTCVTWEVKFTISFGGVPGDVGLFFNAHDSVFSAPTTQVTAKGYRIAFMPKTAYASVANEVVVAPMQEAAKCAYVSDKTGTFPKNVAEGTGYGSTDKLIDSAYVATEKSESTLPSDGVAAATAEAREDYLGTFVYYAGAQVHLEYIVAVWFEGTDENIVNRALASEYQSVGATLVFDAINLG